MSYIIKPVNADYNTNIRYIEDLIKEFPFLNAEIQGRTPLGRGIFSLSLGNPRNSVILAGGFHGSDHLTSLILLLFTERLCRCVKYGTQMSGVDIKRAFSQLGVTVIPCINPDGSEIALKGFESGGQMRKYILSVANCNHESWDANATGVDISRNFSAGFDKARENAVAEGINGPCHKSFGGEHAESEAETRVLTRLCRMKKFRQCMALQTGERALISQYGDSTPIKSNMMAKILADSCSCALIDNNSPIAHGGFMGWFIDEFGAPGFTLRAGNSKADKLYETYSAVEEALLLFTLM